MLVLNAPGIRVVARPEALDAAVWHDLSTPDWDDGLVVYRFAPDEAFGIVGPWGKVDVDDPDAIIEDETGFISILFEADEFKEFLEPHIDWPIPVARPTACAQGSVAGVPTKVNFHESGEASILVLRAYAHDLISRLGIPVGMAAPPWPR